jgi:hypothetical protein
MNQFNYDFNEYQRSFNRIAREILFESSQADEENCPVDDDV